MIFYINHFSLIIFYHSVWLGFELFGLRAQVYSQLVQFTLTCKGYDNHHCHNKPPDRKWAGVWMTSCPEKMVLRIWGFLKKSQLRVEIGPWKQKVGFLPLGHRVEFSTVEACSWVFRISTDWDFKHHKMNCSLKWGQIVWLA